MTEGGPLVKIADDLYDEAESHWPSFCFGSANSWLLIVGPSPGESEPRKSVLDSEYKKLSYKLWLGASHPGFTFRDGSNYFQHIGELLLDNFSKASNLDASLGRALTHHGNLLPQKSAKEDRARLSDSLAVKRITHIFRETRPQCVIALTEAVFEVLQGLFGNSVKSGKLVFHTQRRIYRPEWELREVENHGKILFARTPNHPVRHGFWLLPEFASALASIAKKELNSNL